MSNVNEDQPAEPLDGQAPELALLMDASGVRGGQALAPGAEIPEPLRILPPVAGSADSGQDPKENT